MVGEPALQIMRRHPGAPAHFQQLGQVEAVNRNDDEGKCQIGEAAKLGPEHRSVLILQGVIKHPVPFIEQH